MVVSAVEAHPTFVEEKVNQMDEDMGDSPKTPECGWSKIDIEC